LRPVKRALKWVGKTVLASLLSPKMVQGFWSDNWLEPTCKIRVINRLTGHALRLAGTAPVDSTVQVLVDGLVVKTLPLQAKKYETIDFHLAPALAKVVTLKFSRFISDHHRRRLAFLVQDTNLFMEQDLN